MRSRPTRARRPPPAVLVAALHRQLAGPVVIMDHVEAALHVDHADAASTGHFLPADPSGYDQAAACLLDWTRPASAPDAHADDPPALLAAGLNDTKAQVLLETLARHGVNCDVCLLAVESAPDTAWSRAATYCACVQRWGIRVCGRLAELGVVGAPIPATRGPPRQAMLGVIEVRSPRQATRDSLTTWVMTPHDCTTVHVLVPVDEQACAVQALARAEQDMARRNLVAEVRARPIHGGTYPGARWHGNPDLALHTLTLWGADHSDHARAVADCVHDDLADGGFSSTWTDEDISGALLVPTPYYALATLVHATWASDLDGPIRAQPCVAGGVLAIRGVPHPPASTFF